MSKVKKILILMIIMLGTMFLSNNSVNARSINLNTLKNSDTLYCVNHGKQLNSYDMVDGRVVCPYLRLQCSDIWCVGSDNSLYAL